jgi:hypothetical protein
MQLNDEDLHQLLLRSPSPTKGPEPMDVSGGSGDAEASGSNRIKDESAYNPALLDAVQMLVSKNSFLVRKMVVKQQRCCEIQWQCRCQPR